MSQIELENITKHYENGHIKALNGIDLTIEKGEFVSIIGPSGSGKSTLLNMLGALDKVDSGNITIDGVDLNNTRDLSEFRQNKIGFIFQLHNLIPNLSASENVQIPLVGTKISEKEMEERSKELLETVDLGDRLDQKPTKLSGGQRQRVAIARALVNNPSIILADEPTGSLDSKNSELILNLLIKLHEENDATLIVVTHDNDIARLANRTIKIKDGVIIEDNLN